MSLLAATEDETVDDLATPPFPPKMAASVWRPADAEWSDLTVAEAIDELRLGEQSRYYRDFEYDPCILVDCPNCGPVSIDASGICTWNRACGYDFARFGGPTLHVA